MARHSGTKQNRCRRTTSPCAAMLIAWRRWTTGPAPWQVRPVLCDLTKVADPEPRRFQRRGSIHPAYGVTLHRIVVAMIGRMIRACGADDVAGLDYRSESCAFR